MLRKFGRQLRPIHIIYVSFTVQKYPIFRDRQCYVPANPEAKARPEANIHLSNVVPATSMLLGGRRGGASDI